jgi:hypothetical protein
MPMTLREHWKAQGGEALFNDVDGTVTILKDGEVLSVMPQNRFPLKPRDFDRKVEFYLYDREDGTPPEQLSRLL